MKDIKPSEITPEHVYLSRRDFLKSMGIVSASALLAACAPKDRAGDPVATPGELEVSVTTDELGDPLTPYEAITNYNNYYEFTIDKERVAPLSQGLTTSPWSVEVGGLVNNPKTYDVDDILNKFTQQERIYRLRCVEAWSMVIPWVGFPLGRLLERFEPSSRAKYVAFETLHDPEQMPGQRRAVLDWPYREGLRIDEAMHPLTILAVGMYGEALPNQNGAPLRLVVPWKYGFKGIKSIVRIQLQETRPPTSWSRELPREYGFYANVNPGVDHPRWSQKTERRIGDWRRRETLFLNGYADQVGHLYAGLDLRKHF